MRIVVIGAGILGAALADRLGSQDAEVTVLDAGPPGARTSRSSMAWVNAQAKLPREYYELNFAGMRAHARLAEELGGAWYRQADTLRWAGNPADEERLEQTVARLSDWGYAAHWLSADTAREAEPSLELAQRVEAVASFPQEALVDGQSLTQVLVERARARGVRVRTGPLAEVMAIETAGCRTHGVKLASGELLAADVVVCCAGWRTRELAAMAGAHVSLVPGQEPGSEAPTLLAHIAPAPGAASLERLVLAPDLHARPLSEGRVYLEALDLEVDAHTSPGRVQELAAELLERARRTLPGVAEGARLVEGRVCIRPLPTDGRPIVGWHTSEGVEGLYTMVMHSGITLSLHVADLAARELLGGEEVEELAPYRPARFTA